MVTREALEKLVSPRLNRVLSYVKLVAPGDKFDTCRKLILDEFGRDGLGRDLDRLFEERQGTDGHGAGGPIPRKEGGAP